MENRQSYMLVGGVTVLILLALFGFVLWLARYSGEPKAEYDVFFKQSVSGLAVGSAVTFSGVPVGQVRRIALMPETPEFIRVRVEIGTDVPVLEGTTAALQTVGFTGVTQIQLEGSMRGQKPIEAIGPFGVPVIPAKAGGFTELLESAPQVLERVSTLVARLNELFDDPNRKAIANILTNTDTVTAAVAAEGPAIRAALQEAQVTLKAATRAADQLAATGASADALMNAEGKPLIADLRRTVEAANQALARVDGLAKSAEPGVTALSEETVPDLNRLILDLREVSQSLGALSAKLDEDPLGALVGGRPLPDYVPETEK
jgi:phospholipid/cholesterol/gamma-HCH transport system substrate-binding protein